MPRARRTPKTRTGGLDPAIVDGLIFGYSDGAADQFWIFDNDHREDGEFLPRMWREHRTVVVAEASARGITRPWAQQFDKEKA